LFNLPAHRKRVVILFRTGEVGGQRPLERSVARNESYALLDYSRDQGLNGSVSRPSFNSRLPIGFFIALAALATSFSLQASAQGPSRSTPFVPIGKSRTFAAAHGVYEFVFQAQRGTSPFDRIGLHRITMGRAPAAHPAIVMLYLPGTNMNGEIAPDDLRYSLPLYLASHGVDFWAVDYRTHFVPASVSTASLKEFQTWTNEMFAADISAAARFVMATTGHSRIFIAGFSRGALFTYLYAAAHPENVEGLVIFDGSIGHGRQGSPPPGVYADDVSGKHLTWEKRQALMELVIANPGGPAPLPQFKTAADNLNHVMYESAGFGGKGGLANPVAGLADASVLAQVLIRYDRYWPTVQDYEDSFTPLLAQALAQSRIPVLAFSSTNIAPDWSQSVAKSAASTGSSDVTVKVLNHWGHLDVICGTRAQSEVFTAVLAWLKRHVQAALDSGRKSALLRRGISSAQANAHIPNRKPTIAQNGNDRPRRTAMIVVSGASDASTASEVAIKRLIGS
jgi:pimeloyl-ACP methyl ester carboxylesterase